VTEDDGSRSPAAQRGRASLAGGNPCGVTAWLGPGRPRTGAALRLLAFPYAGGDITIFSAWAEDLSWDIELCPVQLPGRGRRLREPAFDELGPLVRALADGLAPALDGPFAFFGHSMGALVAFELARELRRCGRPLPHHLLVSGRPAPQLPRRYDSLAHLPDAEFFARLHERYGYELPQAEGLEELMSLLAPMVRSDVLVSDRYVYTDEPPLPCPITAFGGIADATVTRDELSAWQRQTTGRFETRLLPGGHFFLESARQFLVRFIVDSLRSALPRR
jgi:medium-chain acyl-[acyl-carrier-protein] hydrolase